LITDTEHTLSDPKIAQLYFVNSSLKKVDNYFRAIRTYQTILEEEKPDIIHIQQISTYSFLLLRALKRTKLHILVVLTTWGSDILVLPKRGWIFKKMVQYVLNHCDAYTTDAHFVAEKMQELARKPLHTCIANFGINIVDIPQKKEKIIYSNRLHEPLYRIDKIISAFHFFVSQHPDWKLVIGATGSETESLKEMVRHLHLDEWITFIGWVDPVRNSTMYAKSTIWISLPKSDATSISLLEAMSFGCLPIVIDLPANREWIKDGENGIIVQDIESNFFEDALALSIENVAHINKEIIAQKGTKEVNRLLFYKLYDELQVKVD